MSEIKASWSAGLYCDCPYCKQSVDLLDAPDFWDGRTIEIAEHNTKATKDMEVVCPECDHEFEVDCEW